MSSEMKAGLAAAIPCVLALGLLVALAVHRGQQTAKPFVPPFQGESTAKPIDFDLVGTWKVMRFGTRESPGRLGPWSAKWHLEKTGPDEWRDTNGQGSFRLFRPVNGPEQLKWTEPNNGQWFRINEQSFGFLLMTGDDGEQYNAVRTEGGEK